MYTYFKGAVTLQISKNEKVNYTYSINISLNHGLKTSLFLLIFACFYISFTNKK